MHAMQSAWCGRCIPSAWARIPDSDAITLADATPGAKLRCDARMMAPATYASAHATAVLHGAWRADAVTVCIHVHASA